MSTSHVTLRFAIRGPVDRLERPTDLIDALLEELELHPPVLFGLEDKDTGASLAFYILRAGVVPDIRELIGE
jgi:hypothetical protein